MDHSVDRVRSSLAVLCPCLMALGACVVAGPSAGGTVRAGTHPASQRAAQAIAPGVAAPACALPPSRDTVLVSVAAALAPEDSAVGIPARYVDRLLFEIGRRLRVPPALPVDTYADVQLTGPPITTYDAGFRSLSAVIEMRLRPDGPPADLVLVASSQSPRFDAALDAALERLVGDGIGALPAGMTRAVTARLTVETLLHPRPQQHVWFEMRTPLVRFDSLARADSANPLPTHPRALRQRRVEGDVKVRFVVAPDGSVAPSSLYVLEADDEAFGDAVVAALMFSRFAPARIGPCPVASMMELWYRFSLM